MSNKTNVERSRRLGGILPWGVLLTFLLSILCQIVLPAIHAREIDSKECHERSCQGQPTTHVERDPVPSHHDSSQCPVCQILHSSQPTDAPSIETLVLLI